MQAAQSVVHGVFVCLEFCVRIFVHGFLCADSWCRVLGQIIGADFRYGFFARICCDFDADFWADSFCDFVQGGRRESDKKKNSKKSIKKSSPKSSPKVPLQNPPQNSPEIPLRIFASRSSLGLKRGVGAHLDALVEVGCQSRCPSGNRWKWLMQG